MKVFQLSICALALASFGLAGIAAAQQPAPTSGGWVMERQLRQRWLHGRQAERFTAFRSHRRALRIDSIRSDSVGRQFFITTDRSAFGKDSTVIIADVLGHIVSYRAARAPYRSQGAQHPGDSARMARFRRFTGSDHLDLVGTRAWDVVVTFPSVPARAAEWTDTIARDVVDDGYRQTVYGRRTSRILRDTIVDGRRLWIVHDSAELRYTEQFPDVERTLPADVVISRNVSGIERGTHLFDPALGLYRSRDDTAELRGEALLRYPDGRSYRTPATYQRSRHWTLYDSAQYAARVLALNAESRRTSGGMVRVPTTLQRRLIGRAIRP